MSFFLVCEVCIPVVFLLFQPLFVCSVVGAWVRMCMVILFQSWLFSAVCLHTGLFFVCEVFY